MASVFLENVARNERRRKQRERERRSGVPRPFRGSRKQGIFNVSTRRKETLAGYNYIGFWGVGREGGRGGRSKSRLGKQGGMECVSTPLYVWSRDKKPGLPNFPPLESRATLRGRRRRRRRRRLFLSPLSSVSSFSFSFASPPFPQFCVRVSSRQVGRRSAAEGNERGRDTGEEEKSGAVRETPQRVTAFNLVLQTLAAS